MNEDDTNETNDERRRRAITGRTDGRNHRKFAYVDLTAPKVAAGKNTRAKALVIFTHLFTVG